MDEVFMLLPLVIPMFAMPAMPLAMAMAGECMGAAGIIGWEPMFVDEVLGEILGMAKAEMGGVDVNAGVDVDVDVDRGGCRGLDAGG